MRTPRFVEAFFYIIVFIVIVVVIVTVLLFVCDDHLNIACIQSCLLASFVTKTHQLELLQP